MKLEHVALSVADLERSMDFYCGLLGFELDCIIESRDGGKLGEIVGLPGCRARIAKLQSGAMILELFEYLAPRGRRLPSGRSQADHGFTHIGFSSPDIMADFQKLKAADVKFYGEPIEYRPGVWNVYFYGPDGETCELRQQCKVGKPAE